MKLKTTFIATIIVAAAMIITSYCYYQRDERVLKRIKAGDKGTIIDYVVPCRFGTIGVTYYQDGVLHGPMYMTYPEYDSLIRIADEQRP